MANGPAEWVKGVASLKTRFAGTGIGFPAVSPPVTPPPTGGDAGLVLPQTEAAAKAYWAGATEYFCSPTGANTLSGNSPTSPANANYAVNNAPTRSIITLLNSVARYPAIVDLTGGGRRLWIRAQTPIFQDIDTSVSPAIVIGQASASACARVADCHLEGFGGCFVEGLYADMQAGGGFHIESGTGQTWVARCRTYNVAAQGVQLTAIPEGVAYKCWVKCDKLAVNAGGPSDKSGWRTDYHMWAWGPGKFYFAGNFLEGNSNNGISLKQDVDEAHYSGNSWHLWATDTYPAGSPAGSGTSYGTSGIFAGQTGDYDSDSNDRTIGLVTITGQVFSARRAYFIQFQNVQDMIATDNRVISSNGMTIDTADHSDVLRGPWQPRLFEFKDNIIENSNYKLYRAYTYATNFVCSLESNTTPTLLAIENIASNNPITNNAGNAAGVWTSSRAAITRVGGNASGFGPVPA